jgi:glycerol-3-phosphate responsive antiterminator
MNKEVQSLLQYAEILNVQVEDLKEIVETVMQEKSNMVNSDLAAQLDFLLTESQDPDAVRFILKEVTGNGRQ